MWKKTRWILIIAMIIALIAAGLIIGYFATIITINSNSNYSPPVTDTLAVTEGRKAWLFPDENISMISWNIGYCGLGKEMDFFYEGGKKMRPEKDLYKSYLNAVFNIVSAMDSVDFLLLQEVDFDARRTFYSHQDSSLMQALPDFSSAKAVNYDVPYVPFPLFNPMAKVYSGMMTFSRYIPEWAHRISYPGSYSWPMSVFFLDRCFIIMRYEIDSEKDLYVINTHNSAYSDAGDIRVAELLFLRSFVLDLYSRGHYVIAGGDWNQNPPGFNPAEIKTGDKVRMVGTSVSNDFLPEGWKWVYDHNTPTNRDVNISYQKGTTTTTIIDYFLCSPNIEVNEVKTIDMGFTHSDHNPVYLNFALIPDSACCDSMGVYEAVKEKIALEKKNRKKKK